MLTDSKLKNLKPTDKQYKVADALGLYVVVTPSGNKSFRFDYRFQGKRKTLVIGKYGPDGITLTEARERLAEARRQLADGACPATQKRNKNVENQTFSTFFHMYLKSKPLAETTTQSICSIYSRYLEGAIGNVSMSNISVLLVRNVMQSAVDSGAPSASLVSHSIISRVFNHAKALGYKFDSPTNYISQSAMYKIKPRSRYLTPEEVRDFFSALDKFVENRRNACLMKIYLYTLVRKSELLKAKWCDIDFEKRLWFIPSNNTKMSTEHTVPLSSQALMLFSELKSISSGSVFVAESCSAASGHLTPTALLLMLYNLIERSGMKHFTIHDLRRTASTHLNEMGYNPDWIEKSLAHESRGVRAVYNKAKYIKQRRRMLQEWADTVERWASGDFSGEIGDEY